MRGDHVWAGFLAGLAAPIIGLYLYAVIVTLSAWRQLSALDFLRTTILGVRSNIAPVLSISLFASVGLFFLLDRRGMHRAMRGVIASMFIYGIAILIALFQWGKGSM